MVINPVIFQLRDLIEQATTERSHYYVKSCCLAAIEEIIRLEMLLAKPAEPKRRKRKA